MVEFFDELVFFELIPASGIDVAADTLNIKYTFYRNENVGLETNVIDMVVPAGMLAERSYEDPFKRVILPLWIKAFEKVFKSSAQNTYLRKINACLSMTAIDPDLES